MDREKKVKNKKISKTHEVTAIQSDLVDVDKITFALLKKALGFKANEVVEEYVCNSDSGELILQKKKITTKQVPPDLVAAKNILELARAKDKGLEEMTDEELENERKRLLTELQENMHKGGDEK